MPVEYQKIVLANLIMNHLLLKQTILYSFQPLSPCIISYLFTNAHTCVQSFSTTPTRVLSCVQSHRRGFEVFASIICFLHNTCVKTCCIVDEVNDQLRAVIRYIREHGYEMREYPARYLPTLSASLYAILVLLSAA